MMATRKPRVRVDSISLDWTSDPYGTADNPQADAVACIATATVSYQISPQGDRRLETLTSGGLHGIDLPIGTDYRDTINEGQLEDLRLHLAVFGIRPTPAEWMELRRKATEDK